MTVGRQAEANEPRPPHMLLAVSPPVAASARPPPSVAAARGTPHHSVMQAAPPVANAGPRLAQVAAAMLEAATARPLRPLLATMAEAWLE